MFTADRFSSVGPGLRQAVADTGAPSAWTRSGCTPSLRAAGPFSAWGGRARWPGRGPGGPPARYRGRAAQRRPATDPALRRRRAGCCAGSPTPKNRSNHKTSMRPSHVPPCSHAGPRSKATHRPPMPEAVHRCHRPLADRAGREGLAGRHAPRRARRADGRAALAKVPQLDPHEIEDLYLGLRPARRRAGLQHGPRRRGPARLSTTCPAPRSPGTARRRCRPPGWRSTRSRPARATCSSRPASRPCRASPAAAPTACPAPNPALRRRPAPHRPRPRPSGGGVARPARATASCPTSTSRWARRRRTWRGCKGISREEMDEFGVRSQNLAEKAIADGFWAARDHPGDAARRHRGQRRRRPAARRDHGGASPGSSRCSARTAGSPPATAARSTTARRPWS